MPGTANVDVDVVVIGAGFSGLYALHRLRSDGHRVLVVDAAPGLGGVWHWNRYPGARVDSHVPNYELSVPEIWQTWNWSERFPGRDELVSYFNHTAGVLDLGPDIALNRRVAGARFDETESSWTVEFDDGDQTRSRFVLVCTGFASKPYVPDLPGLDSFRGRWYHSAAWPDGGLDMTGLKVAVVGTGATAVQITQEAAASAESLTVFQRTPVTALPMGQRRLTVEEQAAAKAEYPAVFRQRNNPPSSFSDIRRLDEAALGVSAARRQEVYDDAWEAGGFHFWAGTFNDILVDSEANRTSYDYWRSRVRERIDDAQVADILAPAKPPYPFGTKRPSLEQNYYDVFNQPNVNLVDLRSEPIGEITRSGIRFGERHQEFDLIALATGFDANTGGLVELDLVGTDGRTLGDHWSDGVQTNLGLAVAGFPNMFFVYGPQSPVAFCNGPTCAEVQGNWIAECLAYLGNNGHTKIESKERADRQWAKYVDMVAANTLFNKADSWYVGSNIPGKRRQLLSFPSYDDYHQRLMATAEADYRGFTLL